MEADPRVGCRRWTRTKVERLTLQRGETLVVTTERSKVVLRQKLLQRINLIIHEWYIHQAFSGTRSGSLKPEPTGGSAGDDTHPSFTFQRAITLDTKVKGINCQKSK